MNTRPGISRIGLLIGVIVALAIGVGVVAVVRIDWSGERGSGLPEAFDYDLEKYQKIDPELVHYEQNAEILVGMHEVRAVAVGPEDRIFVAGDRTIRSFAPDGKKLNELALEQEPFCLAVGNAEHKSPGRIYVGMRDHIEVFNADGTRESAWERPPGKRTVLTSIAAAEDDVFVADAGALVVWHYDLQGKLLGSIGKRDPERGIPGFVIPSPYFDVAVAPDGLLRVVNPGAHRIEAFTFDGHLEVSWGKRGLGIEAFCGCCNPSHIAIMADGRVVTAEKGISRVKVYSESGKFECVVVGPDVLAPNRLAAVETRDELRLHPVELAVDSRDRILVLDPAVGCVRIFEHK
jgi:sugar lactone lactonase YvrE